MKISIALAATLFLPALVGAQYGNPAPATTANGASSAASSTPTFTIPASNSTNINVQVAPGGNLVYNPANFSAPNGTVVTFFIPSGPHSVTQGSFANPCVYLANGFDSGLQNSKEFSITITNDQEPIWFFCKNTIHCGLGMTGAINAPTTGNTYAAFLAAAKALGSSEVPLSDSGPVTGGVGALATGAPSAIPTGTSGTSTPAASTTTSKPSSSTHLVANSLLALLAAAFSIMLT
jgi:plastocyanin